MRIVSLILVLSLLSVVWAQEGAGEKGNSAQELSRVPPAYEMPPVLKRMRSNIPATLAEAHAELERMLSPETLARIDAMESEGDMGRYHFSLGLNIRNGWGLWAGSPLAEHMQELGFTHPDDMSGVILETFWCKRHGKDFRLQERAAAPAKAAEAFEKARQDHIQRAKAIVWDVSIKGVLSVVLLLSGLVCLIIPQVFLCRQSVWSLSGCGLMSGRYAALHKVAYLLMGAGVLLTLLLLNTLRIAG